MSWFYERFTVPSEINGPITCLRTLGQWSVTAGGNGQANPYLNQLWKEAFQKLPEDLPIRRILMLGFGPGETLRLYAKRFPKASLTVIEIDPVMVDLARRFGRLSGSRTPEILIGDALEVLPRIQGQYDLIVLDLFSGMKVAHASYEQTLVSSVLRLLQPHGAILMNAYLEPLAFEPLQKHCALVKRWMFRHSHVALFRPWGSGTVGDPLPAVYQHSMTCEAFIRREYAHQQRRYEVVHSGQAVGVRKKLPGFVFDYYYGDQDPALGDRPKGARLTFWQPIESVPKRPVGWRRCPFPGNRQLTGFAQIPLEGSYHTHWSDHAKRHRERWLKQTDYELVDADVKTYNDAFATCGKRRSLISIFSDEVRRKAEANGDRLTLRIARHKETREIIAGFAALWIPEIQQTFHVTSFITSAGQKTSVAFGLVDDCFRIAQARGCRTLEFDGFWTKGSPNSWKGFSRFKSQFGIFYVRWPGLWVRWD
jgi:ubiquinone/menaquinone biosynthesis C-methylase UbiE